MGGKGSGRKPDNDELFMELACSSDEGRQFHEHVAQQLQTLDRQLTVISSFVRQLLQQNQSESSRHSSMYRMAVTRNPEAVPT